MKKLCTTFAALLMVTASFAQDAFWTTTSYRGAFPVTDNTAATDWTSGWSNFDPQNTAYPSTPTLTVSSDVTTNTTWSGVVLIVNKIYVRNNATLTIQPGTIILGDKATQGSLIVTRGAKLNAIGTQSQPIVFTSNQAIGSRAPGDWGGVVILGLARNNQPTGVANIEGIVPTTDTQFGGNFDTDNSGTIKYVRIEFAGIALEPNKEINGLTMGSVGSGTTIDYVQVTLSGDDSFEWFGGTVNCKHLISYRAVDDDFDTDFGYRGKVQFGLIIRDKDLSDAIGDSNGFESDNDAAGSTAQPKTRPIFSNVTLVGAKGNGTVTLPTGEKHERAFRLRRNTATNVFNSIATGFEKGLYCEGSAVVNNLNGDTMVFANNILTNFATPTWNSNNTNTQVASPATTSWYQSWWGADNNDSTKTLSQVNWVNMFTAMGSAPDARLASGSVAATGANFTDAKFFSVAAPTVAVTSYTYCQGASATALVATAIPGNTLAWYTVASGGTSSSSLTPSTTTAGSFTYYVSQKNSAGDESPRVAISVTVNQSPVVSSNTNIICTGIPIVLTSSVTTGLQWQKATTSTGTYTNVTGATAATYTPTAVGFYRVLSSSVVPACSTSNVNQVSTGVATTTPTMSLTSSSSLTSSQLTVCVGGSVTFTANTAVTNPTYQWFKSTTAIAGATSSTYTVNATATTAAGAYNVKVTENGKCPSAASTSQSVVVSALPTTPVVSLNVATANYALCGGTVALKSSVAPSTTASLKWFRNDTLISGATAQVYTASVAGTYKVQVTNPSTMCSSLISNGYVVIAGSPASAAVVSVTSTDGPAMCGASTVSTTLSSSVAVATGTTLQWQKNGVNITGATTQTRSITNTHANVGTYRVVRTTVGSCPSTSNEISITAGTAATTTPTVSTVSSTGTASTVTVLSNTVQTIYLKSSVAPITQTSTVAPVILKWFRNDTLISGASTQTIQVTTAGSYKVQAFYGTSQCAGVMSAAKVITGTSPLGIIMGNTDVVDRTDAQERLDVELTWDAAAMPNPYNEYVTVSLSTESTSPVTITMVDAMGKEVSRKQTTVEGIESVQLGDQLTPGVYMITVRQDENVEMIRVIKQ